MWQHHSVVVLRHRHIPQQPNLVAMLYMTSASAQS
jgi:hypothetical protein